MKQFLVFAGVEDLGIAGFYDFQGSFEDFNEARLFCQSLQYIDYYHIVDRDKQEIVDKWEKE